MDNYNFWQDLVDTYQSLSDWLKILWLIVPPAFMLGLVALTLRFRIESRKVERRFDGELVYSIHRDAGNQLHVVSHIPLAGGKTPLLLLDPAETTEAARDLIGK
ncbi:hypothetical protein [Phyllobacterium sp.]|uniref:hypothetical protein n=1 Tax=unclassified Phyllobacterium TaxID=2638441 RepID=UPI001AC7736B|nr:hypothetical protein [Phyllobacterium sp.]MBQ9351699.1 hypothetical protein [Phyllobacterium sp.]